MRCVQSIIPGSMAAEGRTALYKSTFMFTIQVEAAVVSYTSGLDRTAIAHHC